MSKPFSFAASSFSTLNTSEGIENLPPFANKAGACALSVAENVRFTREGGVYNRRGFEQKADLGTSAKVQDMCTLPTVGGLMFAKSGTKIFYTQDGITWYDTGLTRTATAPEFLYPHEQDVYAVNGIDPQVRIAVSKVTKAIADTDTQITVQDIENFASTGTVLINGDSITYTGSLPSAVFTADHTTDTLTSNGHGLLDGDIVQLSNTGGALPFELMPFSPPVQLTYYVVSATTNTFKVATTSGGTAVPFTDNGTGTHTFTAIGFSRLTGVSGIQAGGHAVDSIVIQISTTGAPLGTCIAELEGSMMIGKGDTIQVSLPSTDAEPELFYDFTLADGASAKRLSSEVTALKTGLGVVLIGMKNGMDIASGFQLDSGALLTSPLSRVHSIPNARCITEMDKEFAILTTEGRILPVMNFDTGFQIVDDPNNPRNNMDFAIQGWIRANKSDENTGNFIAYDPAARILTATILLNTGITAELVYQREIGAWSIDTTKNFACKTPFKGRMYCGSDTDDKVYLDDEGALDDIFPITSRIVTGIFRLGRKGVTGEYHDLVHGGVINPTGEYTVRLFIDGSLSYEKLVTADELQNLGLMNLESGVPAGSGTVNAETIGTSGTTPDVYRFDYPIELLTEGETAQLEWEITDEGAQIEIRFFELLGEHDSALLIPHV